MDPITLIIAGTAFLAGHEYSRWKENTAALAAQQTPQTTTTDGDKKTTTDGDKKTTPQSTSEPTTQQQQQQPTQTPTTQTPRATNTNTALQPGGAGN